MLHHWVPIRKQSTSKIKPKIKISDYRPLVTASDYCSDTITVSGSIFDFIQDAGGRVFYCEQTLGLPQYLTWPECILRTPLGHTRCWRQVLVAPKISGSQVLGGGGGGGGGGSPRPENFSPKNKKSVFSACFRDKSVQNL